MGNVLPTTADHNKESKAGAFPPPSEGCWSRADLHRHLVLLHSVPAPQFAAAFAATAPWCALGGVGYQACVIFAVHAEPQEGKDP
eukprot:1157531-Pelagomonas_calceolata.AAC.1